LAHNITGTNMYTIILMHAFLILLFSVERVSIYVVPLICHELTFLGIHLFEFLIIAKFDPGASQ
jgi:hypothetical protein